MRCPFHKTDHNVGQHIAGLITAINLFKEAIVTVISDFAAKQQAHNDAVSKSLDDIQTEITNLNTQIAALQSSSGTVTPADQALLDGIEASGAALQTKAAALDTLTPPVVPTTP